MNNIINQMLKKYDISNKEKYVNALKEIVQEIALSGLAKTDFFDHAAFYGGTALRIFYGLDRFSEDLDFTLLKPEKFDITKYFKVLDDTFKMYGLSFKTELKEKTYDSMISSAFIKGNTLEHMLLISSMDFNKVNIQPNETIKIKLEIDTNPPSDATTEFKYGLMPIPYRVRIYDMPSLFSGKLHAIICRKWKNRFKGRDLYDYIFYLYHNIKPNLKHLKERLIESNKINQEEKFDEVLLKELLIERFNEIDYTSAKKDVYPFVPDKSKIDIWSKEFFVSITKDRL